jgi:hypothetical protein
VYIINSSVNGHLGVPHVFVIVNNAAVKMERYILEIINSFPLDMYPKMV